METMRIQQSVDSTQTFFKGGCMAKKPTESYNWTTLASQRDDMGQSKKDTGFAKQERPPARWHNWLWWVDGLWNTWLRGLPVDQGENDTTFNISVGADVENGGTNTTVIGGSDLLLNDRCHDGVFKDSTGFDPTEATEEDDDFEFGLFEIRNSHDIVLPEYGTQGILGLFMENCSDMYLFVGNRMRAINSQGCSLSGDDSTIINSTASSASSGGTVINSNNSRCTGSRSTVHGCDDHDEDENDTFAVNHLRIVGEEKISSSKRVSANLSLYAFGNDNCKLFASREWSEQSQRYWQFADNVQDYLASTSSGYTDHTITTTNGSNVADGPFGSCLELKSSSNSVSAVVPLVDASDWADDFSNDHMFSAWFSVGSQIREDLVSSPAGGQLDTLSFMTFGQTVNDPLGGHESPMELNFRLNRAGKVENSSGAGIPTSQNNYTVYDSITVYTPGILTGPKSSVTFRIPGNGVWFNLSFRYSLGYYYFYIDGELVGTLNITQIQLGPNGGDMMLVLGNLNSNVSYSHNNFRVAEIQMKHGQGLTISPNDMYKNYAGSRTVAGADDAFENATAHLDIWNSSNQRKVFDVQLAGIENTVASTGNTVYFRAPSYMKDNNCDNLQFAMWPQKYDMN